MENALYPLSEILDTAAKCSSLFRKIHLGWINMCAYNFLVSGPNVHRQFFRPAWEGL